MILHETLTIKDDGGGVLLARQLGAGAASDELLIDVIDAAADGSRSVAQVCLRREDALGLAEWIVKVLGGAS